MLIIRILITLFYIIFKTITTSYKLVVYKSLNGLAPGYMQDMFKYVTDVNVRSIHNADKSKMYLPGRKTLKKYTDNFSYPGGMICQRSRVTYSF